MNDDNHGQEEFDFRLRRLFPALSDEVAAKLCNFLSELVATAENHYSKQLWRHYDLHRTNVDPRRLGKTKKCNVRN